MKRIALAIALALALLGIAHGANWNSEQEPPAPPAANVNWSS